MIISVKIIVKRMILLTTYVFLYNTAVDPSEQFNLWMEKQRS